MKTIYLLRHAKSSWKKEVASDRERPLKKKGKLQADAVSDHLASLLPPPQRVLCSPAVRTRETLAYFLELWPMNEESVLYPEALYLADAGVLQSEIMNLPDSVDIVMLVGHNPGLTDIIHEWSPSKEAYVDSLRTCGFVQIDFHVDDWSEVTGAVGELKLNLRPKNLQA